MLELGFNKEARKMAPVEEYFFWRGKLKAYTNFRVGAEFNKELDLETLHRALNYMCYKYSNLCSTVFETEFNLTVKDCNYGIGLLDKFYLKDILHVINDSNVTMKNALDMVNDTYFEYGISKPTWGLIFLNKKQLLFYADHLLFDGTSGGNFHLRLVDALNATKNTFSKDIYNGLDSIVYDRSNLSIDFTVTPPPDKLLDYSFSWGKLIYSWMTNMAPKWLSNWVQYFFSKNPFENYRNYKTFSTTIKDQDKCTILRFPSKDVKKLISVCRHHKVKLTALITHVALLSITEYTGDCDTLSNIPTNGRSTLDIAKGLELSSNFTPDLGLFMGNVSLDLPSMTKLCPEGEINWDITKTIHGIIHKGVSSSLEDIGLLKLLPLREFVEKNFKNQSLNATFECSNIGNIISEQKEMDDFEIVEAWFDQPYSKTLFSIDAASSLNGMNLTMRCQRQDWLAELAVKIDSYLKAVINDV